MNSPSPTVKVKSATAKVSPKRLETPSKMSSAMCATVVQGRAQRTTGRLVEQRQLAGAEFESRALAGPHGDVRRNPRLHTGARDRAQSDDLRRSEVLGVDDFGAQRSMIGQLDVLRPHAEHEFGVCDALTHFRQRDVDASHPDGSIAR